MPAGLAKKVRYYSSVSVLYALTLLFVLLVFKPLHNYAAAVSSSLPLEVSMPAEKPVISGKPVRIVISSLGIDLPVDKGIYNPADSSWSLSGYHAQFAMLSPLANDNAGNTFIYGHNNKYVFGPLKRISAGAEAQVYTDNNQIFSYSYSDTHAVTPDNISVLQYSGAPIMTIQTCSGAWNEQRQMYTFKFDKVAHL